MLPLTPSGFFGASFTKATLIITGIATVANNVLAQRNSYNLIWKHIVEGQLWRLATHIFTWTSNSEMLFGSLLGYHFRLMERLFGTGKFASFAVVTTALSTALQLTWLGLRSESVAAPGPYGLIFATLVQYYREVPATFYVRVFGVPVSDKMFLYVIALQLALSNPPGSHVSSISGIIAGLIYASGLVPRIQRWRIPAAIQNVFASFGSSTASDPVPRPSIPNRSQARQQVDFNEQQISFLTSMGFARDQVVTALQRTNGDAAAAAELLLNL